MGKSAPSPPAPPDPVASAQAQGAVNLETAIAQGYLNRTNQRSPFGSSVYNQIGTETVGGRSVPRFEQVISLTPGQQNLLTSSEQLGASLLDIGKGQVGRVRDSFNVPLDFSNLTPTLFSGTAGPIPGVNRPPLPPSSPSMGGGAFGVNPISYDQLAQADVANRILANPEAFSAFGVRGTTTTPGGTGSLSGDPIAWQNALNMLPNNGENAFIQDNSGTTTIGPYTFRHEWGKGIRDISAPRPATTTPGSSLAEIDALLRNNQDFRTAAGTAFGVSGTPIDPPATSAPPADNWTPPPAPVNPRQAVEDTLYARATSRLDPQWDRERTRFETQLANQGFARGSEGFTRAMDDFMRGRNDAYTGARNEAIIGGGAEESREAALRMAERQQQINELLALRSQPLNELAALMGTSPGVTNPQFAPPPQTAITPTDFLSAVYGSAGIGAQNYRSQQQAAAANRGGIYGLIGTLGAGALRSPWLGSVIGA